MRKKAYIDPGMASEAFRALGGDPVLLAKGLMGALGSAYTAMESIAVPAAAAKAFTMGLLKGRPHPYLDPTIMPKLWKDKLKYIATKTLTQPASYSVVEAIQQPMYWANRAAAPTVRKYGPVVKELAAAAMKEPGGPAAEQVFRPGVQALNKIAFDFSMIPDALTHLHNSGIGHLLEGQSALSIAGGALGALKGTIRGLQGKQHPLLAAVGKSKLRQAGALGKFTALRMWPLPVSFSAGEAVQAPAYALRKAIDRLGSGTRSAIDSTVKAPVNHAPFFADGVQAVNKIAQDRLTKVASSPIPEENQERLERLDFFLKMRGQGGLEKLGFNQAALNDVARATRFNPLVSNAMEKVAEAVYGPTFKVHLDPALIERFKYAAKVKQAPKFLRKDESKLEADSAFGGACTCGKPSCPVCGTFSQLKIPKGKGKGKGKEEGESSGGGGSSDKVRFKGKSKNPFVKTAQQDDRTFPISRFLTSPITAGVAGGIGGGVAGGMMHGVPGAVGGAALAGGEAALLAAIQRALMARAARGRSRLGGEGQLWDSERAMSEPVRNDSEKIAAKVPIPEGLSNRPLWWDALTSGNVFNPTTQGLAAWELDSMRAAKRITEEKKLNDMVNHLKSLQNPRPKYQGEKTAATLLPPNTKIPIMVTMGALGAATSFAAVKARAEDGTSRMERYFKNMETNHPSGIINDVAHKGMGIAQQLKSMPAVAALIGAGAGTAMGIPAAKNLTKVADADLAKYAGVIDALKRLLSQQGGKAAAGAEKTVAGAERKLVNPTFRRPTGAAGMVNRAERGGVPEFANKRYTLDV